LLSESKGHTFGSCRVRHFGIRHHRKTSPIPRSKVVTFRANRRATTVFYDPANALISRSDDHKYGSMVIPAAGASMKTTVEVPDELYRKAKAEAALRGRKLRDLVEEGLRLVLETPRKTRRPSLAGLTKRARGIIDSGVSDLASSPKHLAGFGGDDRRHR
jgi:hypothetical protein